MFMIFVILGIAAPITGYIINKLASKAFADRQRQRRANYEDKVRAYGPERAGTFTEEQFDAPINTRIIWVGTVLLWVLTFASLIFSAAYSVESGKRAIVLRWGAVSSVRDEGLHFRIPIADQVKMVDVKTQKAEAPANAGTKDLQNVDTKVALNYHLNASKLDTIFTEVGLNVEEKIIDPRIQETVKAVIAKYSAEELLKKREDVKKEIAVMLRTQMGAYNLIVEDIQITNFHFSKAFNDAIEAKQTAEQEAMKAKNDLERIKVEAEQRITKAEAGAKEIQIQAEAVRAQGGKEYVMLQAIAKWDGKLPVYTGGSAPLPFIDVGK